MPCPRSQVLWDGPERKVTSDSSSGDKKGPRSPSRPLQSPPGRPLGVPSAPSMWAGAWSRRAGGARGSAGAWRRRT